MSPTCPSCGADLAAAPPAAPCPNCGSQAGAPSIDALLAKALDELRTLPEEQVRQVLEAARVALARAPTVQVLEGTTRGSARLSGEPIVIRGSGRLAGTAELVREKVTATDAYDAEVLQPARSILVKLLEARGSERSPGGATLTVTYPPPWSVAGWIQRHPVLAWLLATVAEPYVLKLYEEGVRQLMALIAAGHLAATQPATPRGESPWPPAIVEPAQQPPPNICLPPEPPPLLKRP